MHWNDTGGWEIAEIIDEVLRQKSREFVVERQSIACTLHESTDGANHSRMVVHWYVVHDWKRAQDV